MSHDGMEQLIVEKLLEHGFTEASSKPGLFFKEVNEHTTVYADFRNGKERWYGFYDKTRPMPDNDVSQLTKHVKRDLMAIGVKPLDQFAPGGADDWKPAKTFDFKQVEFYCTEDADMMTPITELPTDKFGHRKVLLQCPKCRAIRAEEIDVTK